MTKQEIVNILKENKIKGIAFYFLSEDIQDWIHDNFNNPNLLYLDHMGDWQYFKYADFDDYDNVVFALPDMYALSEDKEESEQKYIADSMLLAARVLRSNCIKINCQECVLCRNEECLLNLHPSYWNLNENKQ